MNGKMNKNKIDNENSMDYYEKESMVMSIALLVIFIAIILAILIHYGKI